MLEPGQSARQPEIVRSEDGAHIHCVHAGSGPAVLLAHGYLLELGFFDLVFDELVRSGYRAIAFDQRGTAARAAAATATTRLQPPPTTARCSSTSIQRTPSWWRTRWAAPRAGVLPAAPRDRAATAATPGAATQPAPPRSRVPPGRRPAPCGAEVGEVHKLAAALGCDPALLCASRRADVPAEEPRPRDLSLTFARYCAQFGAPPGRNMTSASARVVSALRRQRSPHGWRSVV